MGTYTREKGSRRAGNEDIYEERGKNDSNAPKQYGKENPRYESMYRMGGSENQPQWKKNLRYEGSAFVPWGAPDPYDHFFEDETRDQHEGGRAPLAPKDGVFGVI